MAVYAYGEPDSVNDKQFIYDSLVNQKISRFLWSWFHDCDLNRLKNIPCAQMTPDEQTAWDHGKRLLEFCPGDWIIHKHIPDYGKMTAVRLSSEYFYQNPLPAPGTDGRQCFHIDKIFTFDRDDKRVDPVLCKKLKLKGSLYQIHDEKEFYKSLCNLYL